LVLPAAVASPDDSLAEFCNPQDDNTIAIPADKTASFLNEILFNIVDFPLMISFYGDFLFL
jgi:hypothetical protein